MQPGFTLAPRDPFADAKQTLSSWDSCMAKDYCKWPVIVGIVVGGLVALSVIFCIARCICCGAECAICCCKCCSCCGSSSGHKRMKSENGYPPQPYPPQPYASPNPYADARSFAPPPPIVTQYQSHAAPAVARQPSNPSFNPQVNPNFRPASPERPQFATFDARSRPVNEDALPEMPSWKNARSVKVEVEEEAVPDTRGDVEMARLDRNGSPSYAAAGMRASPGPGRSPVSPLQSTNAAAFHQLDRRGSPAESYSQVSSVSDPYQPSNPYSQHSDPYSQSADPYSQSPAQQRTPYTQPYLRPAQHSPYAESEERYSPPTERYNSPLDRYNSPSERFIPPPERYNSPAERYNSPAPPSYHTNANPYAAAPPPPQPYDQQRSYTPGSGYGSGTGNSAYDPVPRAQTQTPSAYPGQQTYQAFQPQGQPDGYTGVSRKPIAGSAGEF